MHCGLGGDGFVFIGCFERKDAVQSRFCELLRIFVAVDGHVENVVASHGLEELAYEGSGKRVLLSVEAEEVYKYGVALRAVVGHFFLCNKETNFIR